MEFTTVVAVDVSRVDALRVSWLTWKSLRPEILESPLLLVCDGERPERDWRKSLRFIDHPSKRFLRWMEPAGEREARMQAGLVFAANQIVTRWMLILDASVHAVAPSPWIDAAWFAADADGRRPVVVGWRWGDTAPGSDVAILDAWSNGVAGLRERPRPGFHRGTDEKGWVHSSPQFSARCCFLDSAWARSIARLCRGALPVSKADTLWWYAAARRGDLAKGVELHKAWEQTQGPPRLTAANEWLCAPTKAGSTPSTWPLEIHLTVDPVPPATIDRVAARRSRAGTIPLNVSTRARDRRGAIYLIHDEGEAILLTVSLWALRRWFDGPVCIYASPAATRVAELICSDASLNARVQKIADSGSQDPSQAVVKVETLLRSPFGTTLFLSVDSLPCGNLDPLLTAAEESDLCLVPSDASVASPPNRQELSRWLDLKPPPFALPLLRQLIEAAERMQRVPDLDILAYRRGIPFLQVWKSATVAGRNLPRADQAAGRILVPRFSHRWSDGRFNRSSISKANMDDMRILRVAQDRDDGLPDDGTWRDAFSECLRRNFADVLAWAVSTRPALAPMVHQAVAAGSYYVRTHLARPARDSTLNSDMDNAAAERERPAVTIDSKTHRAAAQSKCGVLTSSAAQFWPVLRVLVHSCRQEGIPVAVMDHGLATVQREALLDEAVIVLSAGECYASMLEKVRRHVARGQRGPCETWLRPMLCKASPFERTIWIDADAVPLRGLAELLGRLDEKSWLTKDWWMTEQESFDLYKAVVEALHGGLPAHYRRICRINTGVFGFRRGDAWLDEWMDLCERIVVSTELRLRNACREQGALVALLAIREQTSVDVLDDPSYNYPANGASSRQRWKRKAYDLSAAPGQVLQELQADHPQARVVHWMGMPKPWKL